MKLPGLLFENSEFTIFFGNGNVGADELAKIFPEFEFRHVNQTHSDIAVESQTGETPTADAHFTQAFNIALLIRTADCLPIVIATPGYGICAIHAGWRGVESNIIGKAIAKYGPKTRGCAVIGPHLKERSFEVGADVAVRLTETYHRAGGTCIPTLLEHQDPKKKYINLTMIARQQILKTGIKEIIALDTNTYTSTHLESFRRDGDHAGRNWSFIARKAHA